MVNVRKPMRAAVVGCGFFARNHLHAWQEIPDVELVAVCDVLASRARLAAEEFGVPAWYQDAESMIKQRELDFVDVATTPPSHRALVELAARYHVPVICQKPMAIAFSDAEAMVAACARSGTPLMVHENFRWQTPLRTVHDMLQAGAVGRPFFSRISFRTGHNIFANQPYLAEETRFILADLGVHMIDVARFFFGEPQALVCQALRIRPNIRGEDAATILLEYDNATCILDFTYSSYPDEDLFPQVLARVEGQDGTIDLGPHYGLTVARRGEAVERVQLAIPQYSWSTPPWEAVQDSVVNIQRHWVDCLRTGRSPETSGEDNLRTLQLVEGSYQSAETNSVYHPAALTASDGRATGPGPGAWSARQAARPETG